MRVRRFEWEGAAQTATQIRQWSLSAMPEADVGRIEHQILSSKNRDDVLLRLTAEFDAIHISHLSLRVGPEEQSSALSKITPSLRKSMEIAAANIQAVAQAQINPDPLSITLDQGQSITLREVPIGSAGVYAPGGRAAYPSSVLMCAIPARVAGVERIALATPPGPDGQVSPVVLAAAALCGVDEVYAVGGAQAIFGLAYGTETITSVDAITGPGNVWVREAKRSVSGVVAIDSLAGPSELMVVTGPETDPEWAALDLCAQAEHGAEGPLVATAESDEALERLQEAVERAAAERPGLGDAPLALVLPPGFDEAIELANAFAPEHLQLFDAGAAALADRVTTAGCIFAGPHSATAFGDYVAGSNHVLPTGGAGRFSGPLGPGVFRRKIATVEVPEGAAAKLAPHVKALAEAEGFPVHGESAMIRAEGAKDE